MRVRHRHRRHGPGFTLIELMIAIGIVAILAAIAVPSFQSVSLSMRLTSYANEFVAATMLARGTAINQNATVMLCKSSDGATCGGSGGWETGYLLTCQSSNGSVCTNATGLGLTTIVLHRQAALATGWKLTPSGSLSTIYFSPTGTGATTGSLTLCRATPTVGANERVISITPTGRTTVAKTSNGACS